LKKITDQAYEDYNNSTYAVTIVTDILNMARDGYITKIQSQDLIDQTFKIGLGCQKMDIAAKHVAEIMKKHGLTPNFGLEND
jgi:hypothetical protein